MSVMCRMSAGREFETDGPATENAIHQTWWRSVELGMYENVSVEERSPCQRDDA